jgi:acetyl-CoA carboxylase carboxyltransferase component
VLASRPDQNHGLLTAAGIRHIARFLEVAGRLGTPLLSVVDSGGVTWEVQPAMLETFRDCLLAMHNLRVPRFILLAGDAFGAAASLYGLGMRADLVSAWPRARIAADADVDAAGSSVLTAARAGLVPDVIHPDETYAWLRDVLRIGAAAQGQEAVRG